MRVTWLLAGIGLATLITADAFVTNFTLSGLPTRWNLTAPRNTHPNVVNPQTRAVRYFIGGETYSAANREAEIQAIRNCFLQWQSVPGSILKFEEGGVMPGRVDVNTIDNTNVVFWTKSTTLVNNQMDDISGATGVTFSDYFGDNSIAESDIVLNGAQFGWFTDYNNPVASFHFVESVMTHEIGHFVGLDHSPLGAATMYARGATGVNVQAELSADEIAAVRHLYPDAVMPATLATVAGRVTMNGAGIYGAAVIIEDAHGNAAGGTVTRTNGVYELPALPPGDYRARVAPLDPATLPASARLTTGRDIERRFENAATSFLPTEDIPVTLVAGITKTLDIAVTPGSPKFRISRLRQPVDNPEFLVVVNSASSLSPGDRNLFVGVYSPDLPASDATLTITGDGLTIGPASFRPNAFVGLNLISVQVSVATNATPGLRSLIVRQGSNVAHASGFIEIQPAFPDINRDGFDDRFQRQYFVTPFAAGAAKQLDPDQDGFDNDAEYISGTDPTNAASVLRVDSVRWDATGATIRWASAPGRRYQVSTRPDGSSDRTWQNIGAPVVANGTTTAFLDAGATDASRLYRIQALPLP